MIVCSKCNHTNMDGAMFCSECGAQLIGSDVLTTQNMSMDVVEESAKRDAHSSKPAPSAVLNTWITLHLMDTGQMLPVSDRGEFTLGRISEGQPIMPDIDLSPYQAYANGVSRLHAVIKRTASRILIMDLGSANGTYINGKRLNPNIEHPLSNGDIIALGKLKIQVLLKTS
ncbi:MAG TPA: FHA domain-containing protein [Anaerolineales bacterium]|nr:FHA domain-containing protein [Anaerolineales bacterium]